MDPRHRFSSSTSGGFPMYSFSSYLGGGGDEGASSSSSAPRFPYSPVTSPLPQPPLFSFSSSYLGGGDEGASSSSSAPRFPYVTSPSSLMQPPPFSFSSAAPQFTYFPPPSQPPLFSSSFSAAPQYHLLPSPPSPLFSSSFSSPPSPMPPLFSSSSSAATQFTYLPLPPPPPPTLQQPLLFSPSPSPSSAYPELTYPPLPSSSPSPPQFFLDNYLQTPSTGYPTPTIQLPSEATLPLVSPPVAVGLEGLPPTTTTWPCNTSANADPSPCMMIPKLEPSETTSIIDTMVLDCKNKVTQFQVKHLKDILHQLGVSRQGKKQELVSKIMSTLENQLQQVSRTDVGWAAKPIVLKIVDDTFRKMRKHTSNVTPSRNLIELARQEMRSGDSTREEVKVHCPCNNSMADGSTIKDVHKKSMELPPWIYCGMCRVSKSDPFWTTVKHILLPVRVPPSKTTIDGSCTAQYLYRSVTVPRTDWELVQQNDDYEIQVWCVLVGDAVPFRMQWPSFSDLLVNGTRVWIVNRNTEQQQLGANDRDYGPLLAKYFREGSNTIVLSTSDTRTFSLGVRIAKRRSLQEVLNLVPREENGETYADALARVRRCVGGGGGGTDGYDSDIAVQSVSLNLRCPMTGSRIRIAARFKSCVHMGCFDLVPFVEHNQHSQKWQCPVCKKNSCMDNLIIDRYFNPITSLIQSLRDGISQIEVKPDASWRAKGRVELKDLAWWHLPDGTICASSSNPLASEDDVIGLSDSDSDMNL